MSRTTLCLLTAGALAAGSLGLMFARHRVLGDEVKVPAGPNIWKVTLLVRGHAQGDGRLVNLTPLDFARQHVLREAFRSNELIEKPTDARHGERRTVLWSKRAGLPDGPFRAQYMFYCKTDVRQPTAPMSELERALYEAPGPGEHLAPEPKSADAEAIATLARDQTNGLERPREQAQALFQFVSRDLANEPNLGGTAERAAECLQTASGTAGGKARLLAALLRSRGIPARLVTGLTLTDGKEQLAHTWVEGWIEEHWLAMCPFHHHFGQVPRTYLVFAFGDTPVVRGRHVRDLHHAFLIERAGAEETPAVEGPGLRRAFLAVSLYMLPPPEQRLVEFLLLLPVAALIVCVFRNVIGLASFGTFAPALIGVAFRETHSVAGIVVFLAVVVLGWGMRRLLNRYHLLQVPRSALLLSLVILALVGSVVVANHFDFAATRYVSIFPIIILTGMIERFWTLETEDGAASSFRTLLGTLIVAGTIALVLSIPAVVKQMFRYPETLGLVMAGQLILGRYTGYRLSELFRFRDFLRDPEALPLSPLPVGERGRGETFPFGVRRASPLWL